MFFKVVMEMAICNVVCLFHMTIQGVLIGWETNRTLLLQFVPLGDSGLATRSPALSPYTIERTNAFICALTLTHSSQELLLQ